MSTEQKHSPEPWTAVPQSDGSAMIAREYETGQQMRPKGLRLIAHALARGNSLKEDEANAARIVACVNYCAGMTAEQLTCDSAQIVREELDRVVAQRDRMLLALERAEAFMSGFEGDELQETLSADLKLVREAIAESQP